MNLLWRENAGLPLGTRGQCGKGGRVWSTATRGSVFKLREKGGGGLVLEITAKKKRECKRRRVGKSHVYGLKKGPERVHQDFSPLFGGRKERCLTWGTDKEKKGHSVGGGKDVLTV